VDSALITLTTDFGYRDPFVGVMKGVILGIDPGARIVDITHGIAPFDIRAGACAIERASRYFPTGSIHVAVVDPGVGSPRRRIAAEAGGQVFIGPDNGVLAPVLDANRDSARVYEIADPGVMLPGAGGTFDGRDVFAPAAAWVARGRRVADLGPRVAQWVESGIPAPEVSADRIAGEIGRIDRFGNAETTIGSALLAALGPTGALRVEVAGRALPIVARYGAAPERGAPAALINSAGFLEVFLDRASAAHALGLAPGATVVVRVEAPYKINGLIVS
jgi:hypothetical protein